MFLLDTDTVIYWLKGRTQVLENLSQHPGDFMGISMLTLMELYYGAHKSQKQAANLAKVRTLESRLPVLDVSREIADVYGLQKSLLKKQGTPLDDFDLAIAATALVHNLVLVTNNMRHYQRIAGLKLSNWSQ
jgi:tRNA(fMet)-specific endonuclease VapC